MLLSCFLSHLDKVDASFCWLLCHPPLFVGFYGRVCRLQIEISYAQNNQEHATGDGSQFITTGRAVPCSRRRVGAARPRGSSPPRPVSLVQPVVGSHVQVRRSGASAPPLTVSACVGGTSCGGLLGPITQPVARGGG